MRIAESVLLGTLKQGGCVRTFWRRSARFADTPAPEIVNANRIVTHPAKVKRTHPC